MGQRCTVDEHENYDLNAEEIERLRSRIEELEKALRDIRDGTLGNAGSCMDCNSAAIVADVALRGRVAP